MISDLWPDIRQDQLLSV